MRHRTLARFLLTSWPFDGHVGPMRDRHAMRERGHEVAFYTGASAQPIIEAEGFRCFAFKRVAEETVHAAEHPDAYARSTLDQLRAFAQIQHGLREWLVDTVPGQVEDLREAMAEWPPDVLVTETAMWGPFLVLSEITPTPVAVFSTFASCLLRGTGVAGLGPWPAAATDGDGALAARACSAG